MRCALFSLLAALLLPACGGDGDASGHASPSDGGADAPSDGMTQDVAYDHADDVEPDVEDAAPPACGTGNRPLPDGLVELAWDDGEAVANLRGQSWAIDLNGTSYVLNEQVLWEGVRFDLEHPARIHGFSVQWAGLPEDAPPDFELTAGLFPDFGYNGFDFWQWDPLWQGTRCAEDVTENSWVDYVFETPIEIEHPGLVYVAHRIDDPTTPVFPFDGTSTGSGNCETFDECHGSMNFPEIDPGSSFNGLTIQFQNDYLVRLQVEYTDNVTPAETIFQPQPFDGSGHVSFGDYDNDGWDDMILEGPKLYHNEGAGEFADVTAAAGISAMGISGTGGVFGDYDNDGCLDLFVFAESTTAADTLLHSNCDGTFTDTTLAAGIVDEQTYNDCGGDPANIRSPTAAAAWADLDADGYLDLYLANFICWAEESFYDGRPTDFYWGNGDGTFRLDAYHAGITTENGWGLAVSDIDHDGDPDTFVNVPFVNTMADADKGHWLQVRAIGNVDANWAAIGATVRVTAGGKVRMRHVQGGTGKGGQDSQYLHFGLGDEQEVSSIEVTFPGGKAVSFAGPFAADQRIWVFEDGATHLGWSPP